MFVYQPPISDNSQYYKFYGTCCLPREYFSGSCGSFFCWNNQNNVSLFLYSYAFSFLINFNEKSNTKIQSTKGKETNWSFEIRKLAQHLQKMCTSPTSRIYQPIYIDISRPALASCLVFIRVGVFPFHQMGPKEWKSPYDIFSLSVYPHVLCQPIQYWQALFLALGSFSSSLYTVTFWIGCVLSIRFKIPAMTLLGPIS